jgi:hypothetical protein
MTDRKKPGMAFRATVAVVVVLLYPLSFGPACWVSSRTNTGASIIPVAYRPMMWGMGREDGFSEALDSYSKLGAAADWHWLDVSDPAVNPYDFVWMHIDATNFDRRTLSP